MNWISSQAGLAAVAVALALVAGALVGSFLNVVVHRVPRGGSVVTGRSRCPSCKGAIQPVDLVPVVGWLVLGGRCRRCAARISPRYPLVEALCGTLLAMLAAGELAAGANGWNAVAVWAVRAAVLLTLLAWTLLAADGHDVSSRTVAVALGAVAAVSTLPGLQPPGIGWCGAAWPRSPAWVGPPLASLVGAAVGWLAGQAAAGTAGRRTGALVGAALGWQAAVGAALVAGLATALATALARMQVRPRPTTRGWSAAAATVAAAAVVVGWRPLLAAWGRCCQGIG